MRRRWFFTVTLLGGLLAAAAILEIGCQIYSKSLYEHLDWLKTLPDHYYAASPNETLVYELAPGFDRETEERRLHVNRYGLREDSDLLFESRRRVAILGDSVVFGVGHSQEHTLSALVEKRLDPNSEDLKALNFGVPGYSLAEIAEFLRVKDEIYNVDETVYLLNLNDFARRDSIYEGADNGLYRMYRRPTLQSPMFLRKGIYRLMKNGSVSSADATLPRWYRWMYNGNRDFGLGRIAAMAAYAAASGMKFQVVILPAGCAFDDAGEYELNDIHKQIGAFLSEKDIPFQDATSYFAVSPETFIDATDHLTLPGNQELAEQMAALISGDSL